MKRLARNMRAKRDKSKIRVNDIPSGQETERQERGLVLTTFVILTTSTKLVLSLDHLDARERHATIFKQRRI